MEGVVMMKGNEMKDGVGMCFIVLSLPNSRRSPD